MQKALIAGCWALTVATCATQAMAAPLNLYVSPQGNDAWTGAQPASETGKANGPFHTLERARDELRRLKQRGPMHEGATVWLRGGFYERNKSFELRAEDSGTAGAPIVYRAMENEKPTFMGGPEISNWKPHGDKAHPQILEADVAGLQLETLQPLDRKLFTGDVPGIELFFDGHRLDLARWPNHIAGDKRDGEWSYIADVPPKSFTQFTVFGDHLKSWAKPAEAQVHVWPSNGWHDEFVGVKSVDAAKREITLATPTRYNLARGRRFFVRNVREELDAPGEWYFDRAAKVILLYPPQTMQNNRVWASVAPTFVNANDVSDISFRGLTLDGYRDRAVTVQDGARVRIEGCTIRNTFGGAISFVGGTEHAAVGNDISETGRGGILMSGGDRKTLTPSNHLAENNHIHHFGRLVKCYQAAVQVAGVGSVVRHNLIHDGPHLGILLAGNDHVLEFNEMHHLCMEGSDNGAFYAGRDWTYRGNVLRYNSIHDIVGYGFDTVDNDKGVIRYSSPHAAQGIYLDDAVGGFHIEGNVLYRIGDRMIQLGGGRDNIIENNIFAGPKTAIGTDARWPTYDWPGHMFPRLTAMPYQTPPWSTKYPALAKPMRNHKWPEGNQFLHNISASLEGNLGGYNAFSHSIPPDMTISEGNLAWNPSGPVGMKVQWLRDGEKNPFQSISWEAWQAAGFDKTGLVADPQFVDAANDNFQLKPTSPAFKLGFQRIPMEKIGVYQDALRASWPVDAMRRKENLTKIYENIPIPGWTPAQNTQSSLRAARVNHAPQIDGVVTPGEWGTPTTLIEQASGRAQKTPTSSAWLRWDAKYLYVAFANPLTEAPTTGAKWGIDDAVEIALRNRSLGNNVLGNPTLGKDAPIILLRGFANGKWQSGAEAGAPANDMARAQQGTTYAAKSSVNAWTAEWRIAWDALGVDLSQKIDLDVNLTVRKPASNLWLMWRDTAGNSWNVENTGQIELVQ